MTEEQDRRDDIMRKISALLAKAASTPFEAEADTFRAKATELMDAYRIEQWEIAKREQGGVKSSLKPIRRDIPVEWWWDRKMGSELWVVFMACAKMCAVVIASRKINSSDKTVPAYGLDSDITFLQMLFTDIHIQMSNKIKPVYDPEKSLGFNVYNAKEAGMTYHQIALWAGHPEWITLKGYSKRGSPQYQYNGIMIREMKKFATQNNLTVHQVANLESYVEDFIESYAWSVRHKIDELRGAHDEGTGMSLAIRDITDISREQMWTDFPDMRPHPPECQCDTCHYIKCQDPNCQRPQCVERRKPIKITKDTHRPVNVVAQARGSLAGQSTRIMSRQEAVGGKNPNQVR
jgi:Protein of unknown function (DUF2786)